jgi:translation elongation factor EF-1beta
MHHPRVTIFAAALSALGVMSFLSALLGNILPGLLPKQYTTAAAAILFFVFGAKMLREGLEMEGGEAGREKMEEEMREVQKEVQEVEEEVIGRPGGLALDEAEEGRSMLRGSPSDAEEGGLPTPVVSGSSSNGLGGHQEPRPAPVQPDLYPGVRPDLPRRMGRPESNHHHRARRCSCKSKSRKELHGRLGQPEGNSRSLLQYSLFRSNRAERLDRHDGDNSRSLDLHRRRRARRAVDLSTHLDQARCVASLPVSRGNRILTEDLRTTPSQ